MSYVQHSLNSCFSSFLSDVTLMLLKENIPGKSYWHYDVIPLKGRHSDSQDHCIPVL